MEAIGVLNSDPSLNKGLVITPSSVKIHWWRSLKQWLMRPLSIFPADPGCFPQSDIVIINYQLLLKYQNLLRSKQYDFVIVDEAHNTKGWPKTKQSRIIYGYEPSKKSDDIPIPPLQARVRIAITGTPMPNNPSEIFPILHWLDPVTFRNRYQFLYKYCGATKGEWGIEMDQTTVDLGKLQDKLRTSVMCRRLKKDVLKELPPKTREIIEFTCKDSTIAAERLAFQSRSAKIANLEAEVEVLKAGEDKTAYLEASQKLSKSIGLIFEEIAELRMAVAKIKMPFVMDYFRERIDQGEKLVSFCYHRFLIEALAKEFNGVIHYGGMSDQDKQLSIDRFMQDPKCLLFSGSIIASREGITLTASSHAVFPELDWRPGIVMQAEDRVHRIGAVNPVLISHLVLEGSLDSNMVRTIIAKQQLLDEALDETPVANVLGKVEVSLREYENKANSITQMQRVAVLEGLKVLAVKCDGATSRDGVGFNKADALIGQRLSVLPYITNRQCLLGQKLLKKYARQLPEELLKKAINE